jgi:Protein of unknown function (DUF3500)
MHHRHLSRKSLFTAAASATAILGAAPLSVAGGPSRVLRADLPAMAHAAVRLRSAAQAFLAGLGTDQLARTRYPHLGDPARTKWSNFPAGASPRAGLPIDALNDAQRIALHDLLRASTSTQGYHKMTGAMRAEDVLAAQEPPQAMGGRPLFGAMNYFVSVYGSPSDASWAWMLTGHHMTAIFTVSHDRVAFTPMFTGAQPMQISTGLHAGWQVLPHDAAYAGELLTSLSAEQQRTVLLGTSAPGDVIAGPGRQKSLASFQGLSADRLTNAQQNLLWLLTQEFVRNAAPDAAEVQLALIDGSWSQTHFAWQGPRPEKSARYYFRVHGPRILIEYDVQEPLVSGGGHVHAITRDPVNDYGVDWLRVHYTEDQNHGGNGPPGGGPPTSTR